MDFISILPRERSGSTSASRFDYQKDIAICMLLEYHESGQDYLFVFDYHDDLVILNSESQPTRYKFFQIKGKESGNWTLSGFLHRKKGKDSSLLPSILGKMYSHLGNFGPKVESISFLSNARLSVKYRGNKKDRFYENLPFSKLDQFNLRTLQNSLEAEVAPSLFQTSFFDISFYKSHNLSIKESNTHTKGKISEFLNNRTNGKKYNVESVYKNIFDQVRRKNNDNASVNDFGELKERKGIGRSDIDLVLRLIGEKKDYDLLWQALDTELAKEDIPFGNRMSFRSQWQNIEIAKMNPTNESIHRCIKAIDEIVLNFKKQNSFEGKSIIHSASLVSQELKNKSQSFPFSENYITTIIFMQLYE